MTAAVIQKELAKLADHQRALSSQRFFKTGPGEYGEGDRFRGIRVPVLRGLARQYRSIPLPEAAELLSSPFHEDRLLALFLFINLYVRGDEGARAKIYSLYLRNTGFINNWDLVDASAEHIVGAFLRERDRQPLYHLAKSSTLWERRIAIMATFHFIKRGEFDETLRLARMLLTDREDLIHKAVGWMLREVGKRDPRTAKVFLRDHYRGMPRVMLRYAIERYPEAERQRYLKRDTTSAF
jgi:3-methyladenine DNA glycosylase AlkD